MYESQTYEVILNRMLARIPSSFDKREGSVIYDALAPSALEIANLYLSMDNMLVETFGDTASRDYLIKLCAERGITPKPASASTVRIVTTPSSLDIPIGSRFNSNVANYVITEKISNGNYNAQCESTGTVGNEYTGTLLPIQYIQGLETVSLSQVLIYGEDEEDTEDLRERYQGSFAEQAFAGNKQDYIDKSLAIAGVGAVKVESCWNGAGTVRLTVLDSENGIATSTLVQAVQTAFDPNGDGQGAGLAPIGHTVTVRTATAVNISILTTITFDTGYSWESLQSYIEAKMEAYIQSLCDTWQSSNSLIVRIASIETKLLEIDGILDIASTTINGSASNLTVTAYQLPVFSSIGENE